jgi:hypothetical protein
MISIPLCEYFATLGWLLLLASVWTRFASSGEMIESKADIPWP